MDHAEIGMSPRFDLDATATDAATISRVRDDIAEQRLRDTNGQQTLSDAILAVKQIRMRQRLLDMAACISFLGRLWPITSAKGITRPASSTISGLYPGLRGGFSE